MSVGRQDPRRLPPEADRSRQRPACVGSEPADEAVRRDGKDDEAHEGVHPQHVTPREQRQMSAKIRLRRMGKKKQAKYRIVVADSRSPSGRALRGEPRLLRPHTPSGPASRWTWSGWTTGWTRARRRLPQSQAWSRRLEPGGNAKVALAGAAPTNGDAEADAAASTDETPESEPAAEPDGSSDDASTVEDESAPPSE